MSGAVLRKKREELGLEITRIADDLRIRKDYLVAIEADDFEKLPPPVFTMGYIRSYAQHLNIDPTEILDVYSKRLPQPKTDTHAIPIVLAEKRTPVFVYITAGVIALMLGAWGYMSFIHKPQSPELSSEMSVSSKQPASPTPDPLSLKTLKAAEVPLQTQTFLERHPEPKNEPAVNPPPAPPEKINPSPSGQDSNDKHTLLVRANEVAWVYVKFSNGKYQQLTMRPGTSREWSFTGSVWVKTGNAGGISLSLDGQDLGPAGEPHQVTSLTLPR